MGNHRAHRHGHDTPTTPATYVGRRVAGAAGPVPVPAPAPLAAPEVTPVVAPVHQLDATTEVPAVAAPGRRRAARTARTRHPLMRAVPPAPVLVGVTTLAIAFGGAMTSVADDATDLASAPTARQLSAPGALTGSSGAGQIDLLGRKSATVSRDSNRQVLEQAAETKLVQAAEKQARQRNAALAAFAKQAEQQAAKIALNQWTLPMDSYRLTAEYGDYGLWANYHTGLDFAGPSGTPIKSVANGVVTSAGYDGSYGNKTVVTLDDGTEIWYAHQTSFAVSVGQSVTAGQVIGSVGATGNVTGPHLHLEVRPGGGDPVDPYAALRVHGLQP